MIKSFKCRHTQSIFDGIIARKLPSNIQRTAKRKLKQIHAAAELKTLMVPPANRLERLKGNRSNQYSIRINQQWRICFKWHSSDAYDVEIVDYH